MERISYSKKSKLGYTTLKFLEENDYDYVGKCAGLCVYAGQGGDAMDVEVVDPRSCRGDRAKRAMTITLTYERKAWHVDIVSVDDKYKGFGLAPKVYRHLMRKLGIVMQCGKMQSPGGRYIWATLASMPGVFMQALDYRNNMYDVEAEDGELYSDEVELYDGRKSIRVLASYGVYA